MAARADYKTISDQGGMSKEVANLLLTQQSQVKFSAFPRILLLMLLRFIDGTA